MNLTTQRRLEDQPHRRDQTLQATLLQARQAAAYRTSTMLQRAAILSEMELLKDRAAQLEPEFGQIHSRLAQLRHLLTQTPAAQ